jgi:hypothetical protein
MKKSTKALFFLCVLVVTVFSALAIWYVWRHHDIYTIHPIRPKDFPEILIATEHAEKVDYQSPSTTHCAPHTYQLSFVTKDPYPSENTRNFIREYLRSNGWQRLNYNLMNPDKPLSKRPLSLFLPPDANFIPPEEQKEDWPLVWNEDWVKDNESIRVHLLHLEPGTEQVCRDKVCVILVLFDRKSWMVPWISRYKKLHPEEFNEVAPTSKTEK